MKIKSLQLKNFKRFTDLVIQDIPENAKLILLIGSNGSGKSSVFDALEVLNRTRLGSVTPSDKYFSKNGSQFEILADFGDGFISKGNKVSFRSNEQIKLPVAAYYGRTSFRQIPRLTRTNLGGNKFDLSSDSDKPYSFIDRDERFENDLEHLFGKLLKEFFRTDEDKNQIKKEVILPINEALQRIFSKENGTKLELLELIPPLQGKIAEVNFRKGSSIFHYNQLSAGEKEVFNILINLLSRKDLSKAIIYFDEIDLHLNTKLQYSFLKEIVENWIPEGSQFWTASHSLGFIQYAKETEHSVIFDFDDFDFDLPKILVPEPKDNPNIYQIAVDKDLLPNLFQGLEVIFVENKDKTYYGSIGIEKTVFIPENGRNGVYHKVKAGVYQGIVDRDFLTDEDIYLIESKFGKLKILRYYSIENYLYHPDNLQEYYDKIQKDFNKADYINLIKNEKNKIKNSIIPSLSLKRTEYPYFGEPEYNGKPEQNRFKNKEENVTESSKLANYLNSDEFETFYKIMPMKTHATQLHQRQNIPKTELSKTNWFKEQMKALINKTI
jgi:AAA15 family ATPase/GTPase